MSTISASTTSTTAYKVTADTTGTLVLQTGSTPTTAVTVGTDQSVTFAQSANLPNTFGFKNRIINGAMVIDQRNAGAATANTISGYTLDRWLINQTTTGKLIVQQNAGSVTLPSGFIKYLGVTSQSAYSVLSSDYYAIVQPIEGFNTADLSWGTASAATVTLSFWVRSSLTGTFGGALFNGSANRSYPFTYTINSANTWEQKTITIAGDQSGTWATDNSVGMYVNFGLGVGSSASGTAGVWAGTLYRSATGATSVVGTSGATFYITGVQLEKGSTATSFDFRSYGTELALCQRYFYKIGGGNIFEMMGTGVVQSSTNAEIMINFPVSMRAGPTGSYSSIPGNYAVANNSAYVASAISFDIYSYNSCRAVVTISGATAGYGGYLRANATTSAALSFSAEL